MTGKQKRYLRALASTMPAVVMIGKGGLENPVIDSARAAITKRELIKVKVLNNCLATQFLVLLLFCTIHHYVR